MTTETTRRQQWESAIQGMKKEATEVPEWIYNEFLNSLPPCYMKGYKFANSEPYSHNSEGKPTFFTFWKKDGKYYGKIQTVTELINL